MSKDSTLLISELQDVFEHMHTMNATKKQVKAEVLTVNTKKLMKKIKAMNQLFDNDDHHDSHEFLMWLLNTIHEEVVAGQGQEKTKEPPRSLVSDVFEGRLVS